MSPTQFSLFFAALLIGYVLVHLRLVRFERYLRQISVLSLLNERLNGVADVLKSVSVERVEERIDLLLGEVDRLRTVAERVEKRLAQPPVAAVAGPAPIAAESGPGERIRSAVERQLFSLGYRDLSILTDLSEASLAEETQVLVECTKNQMPHKGKVVTRNGAIRDVDLQSMARSFP